MFRSFTALLILLILASETLADTPTVKPRLADTPPMGWNSWEAFRRDFDEDMLKAEADAMVSSGLRDAGYTYFVIDGGWKPDKRADDGTLIADPKKFPHGIKALADYVHSKGLKFGLHQPAGMHDCPKLSPGSQNFEEQDAGLFANWGVDFIKYDLCDYVHAKDTTPGSPDFDRFVIRKGDEVIFATETEAAQNRITGLAKIEDRDGCSGGRCVAGVGYDNAAITIPDVTVPEAGKYTLDIHFSNPYFGQGNRFTKLTFFVTVNHSQPQRIDLAYNQHNRYIQRIHTIDIQLDAGANAITFDNPNSQEEEMRRSYVKMATSLNRTGRPILFSISGAQRPWLWAQPYAHLYRCEGDIVDRWSVQGNSITNVLDRHIALLHNTAPEFWPDPDMLEVGKKGRIDDPARRKPAMTDDEYRAQFSLWSIMNAPLFISMDLREIDDATKKILLNKEVIAINQDPLGSPCQCIRNDGDLQIFTKRLMDGVAIACLNRSADAIDTEIATKDAGLTGPATGVRDLWTGQSTPIQNGRITAHIGSHAVAMLHIK
jgi:hypothetical protein